MLNSIAVHRALEHCLDRRERKQFFGHVAQHIGPYSKCSRAWLRPLRRTNSRAVQHSRESILTYTLPDNEVLDVITEIAL